MLFSCEFKMSDFLDKNAGYSLLSHYYIIGGQLKDEKLLNFKVFLSDFSSYIV